MTGDSYNSLLKIDTSTAVGIKIQDKETEEAELQPSLLLHVQYSIKMLYVPLLMRQYRSSPPIPGSPR